MKLRYRLITTSAFLVAVMSLTALSATSAQASGNGLFLINLETIGGYPQSITGHGGTSQLLALGMAIECSLSQFTGSLTAANHAKGKVTFTGCKIPDNEVCLLLSAEVKTNEILAELLLLGTLIRLSAAVSGQVLAKIGILSHEELCALFIGDHKELGIGPDICVAFIGNIALTILEPSLHCNTYYFGENDALVHGAMTISQSMLKVTSHS